MFSRRASLLLVLVCLSRISTVESLRSRRNALLCHVLQGEGTFTDGASSGHQTHKRTYDCIPNGEGNLSYELNLPNRFIREHSESLMAGDLFVLIPEGIIENGASVVYPDEMKLRAVTPPSSFDRRRLEQVSTLGDKKILIVRIIANDASPRFSKDELSTSLFRQGAFSAASQFEACSMGNFRLLPAESEGSLIQNGAMEISLNSNANGATRHELINEATRLAEQQLGAQVTDLADHVMYCLPPGTGNWAAAAFLNHWKSYFNDEFCAYPSGQLHELGHNLNLRHANEDETPYGDRTGYMGASYRRNDGPKMCFNGANSWHLGWYNERSLEIDPSSQPSIVKIAAFVDYNRARSDEYVVVRIGDFYLQYNRKVGFNSGTTEMPNQVTIVKDQGTSTLLLAGLSTSNPLFQYSDDTSNFVFEVCTNGNSNSANSMLVSVGTGHSVCSARLSEPTPAPTPAPSHQPTSQPTGAPSMAADVSFTSSSPSSAPSESSAPSQAPSQSPAPSHSRAPSQAPSIMPSMAPTTHDRGQICDDSPLDEFFVDATVGGETISQLKRCDWLQARPLWQAELCVEGHDANTACPETCGRCTDACEDDAYAKFEVNGIVRNCSWLNLRPNLWETQCVRGSAAHRLCGETCNSCRLP